MSFYESSFLFNNIPSELYSLRIADIDSTAINTAMSSFEVTLYEQKIYRKNIPYFYGATAVPH